jgi:hypothetical protein
MLRIILKEGKAIQATEDMRLFVDEVMEELQQFIKLPLLVFSEVDSFYERNVLGPFGKAKNISVGFRRAPKKLRTGASHGTVINGKKGAEIIIFYWLDENGDPEFAKQHRTLILHELIHCFDPKLEKGIQYGGISDTAEYTRKDVYEDAAEQDAYMRQDAFLMAKSLENLSLEQARETIQQKLKVPDKNLAASQHRLKVWKTDPKMWRKFLNTVYDEVVSRRLPKPKPSKFQQAKQDKEQLTM